MRRFHSSSSIFPCKSAEQSAHRSLSALSAATLFSSPSSSTAITKRVCICGLWRSHNSQFTQFGVRLKSNCLSKRCDSSLLYPMQILNISSTNILLLEMAKQ